MDKVEIIRVQDRTADWHAERGKRLHASDVAVIMGLSEYKSANRLFYEKIDLWPSNIEDNEALFHGRNLEDYVAQCWSHFDGTDYIGHFERGEVQRKCKRLNGIIVNPKYPWLGGNIDRVINKGQMMMEEVDGIWQFAGTINPDFGILEIKTISGYNAKKWENEVPVAYVIQVMTYMLIAGIKYSEIAILKDGRNLKVLPVPFNEEIANTILEVSKDFWYNKVVPGVQLVKEGIVADSQGKREANMEKIHKLEPPPDSSDDYKQFMSDFYQNDHTTLLGSEEDCMHAKLARTAYEIGKAAEKEKALHEQYLIQSLCHQDGEYLDCGDLGKIRYYLKAGGKNKQLSPISNLKWSPDLDQIEQNVNNLVYESK